MEKKYGWDEDESFYIKENTEEEVFELRVWIERSEFTIAKSKDLDYLNGMVSRYMEMMEILCRDYGFDTTDMLLLPESNQVSFFKDDFLVTKRENFSAYPELS